MAGFDEKKGKGMTPRGLQGNPSPGINLLRGFIITVLLLLISITAQAETGQKMAVLPFRIHSLEPLDHLRLGLQEMFVTRMTDKGFTVIPPGLVNKHPLAFLPAFKDSDVLTIGEDLEADLVMTGSLTQIGKKISLDLKILDVSGKNPPSSAFVVEEDIEKMADAADRATKNLYSQIAGVEQIQAIQVKGNRRIESEAILAVTGSRKGEPIDYDQLDKDLRAIYGMGFFKDVRIETEDDPKGKVIVFNVSEKRSIAKIVFDGNRKMDEDDLKKESGIGLYSILNLSEIRQSINRMKEFYRQKGYYDVDIREVVEDLPNNEVSLTYKIKEGEKLYITKIEFIGNTRFDDDDLRDLMETAEKGFFSWFTKSGLLDKKKLEFDLNKVTAFYHNHGYIKAKTGEPKITHDEGKGLTITTEIIEGPQYKVSDVTLEGDLIKPVDELLKTLKINKEEYFNREVVRNDTLALRDVYADEGYAYADVAPFTREDDENHLVAITYRIEKANKVRFERINITGNTVTRDKVIRRELKVIEGDYFSGTKLKNSTSNLYRLGFFENIEVKPRKGSSEDQMILDINLKERPTGSFSIGAGYSSYDNLMGTFQISQDNLFGRGQKIAARARLGSKTTQFDVRFTEPWLFDRPLGLGVEVYKWEREDYDYTKDSLGGALRLSFPVGLDEYTKASVKYSYDSSDISGIEDDAALALREMEGKNVTSSMTFALGRDSRDVLWNTTRGSVNRISYSYAGGILGGDVYFDRYEAKSGWFFPLPWKTVFFAQGQWGYVKGRSGGKLPIYQKYRLGGINTIRGFDFLSISPRDPETDDRIGGEKMMVYNLEYRFPLLSEQGIVGLVFMDAGNVYGDNQDWDFGEIKKSAGAGIRWYSPVGPIRLEYGKNLDPKGDETSGGFEFALGGSF